MRHQEQHLTKGQQALLNFISAMDADNVYRQLHITLTTSMVQADPEDTPTPITHEAHCITLELMGFIHALSVETAH